MKKKKFFFVFSIILFIGIVGSLLTYRSVQTLVSEKRTFDSNNVASIDIDANNSSIEVLPTEDKEIKVTLEGTTSTGVEEEFTTKIDNSTLYIAVDEQQKQWFNVGSIVGGHH